MRPDTARLMAAARLRTREGATAVEYGIMVALIAAVIVAVVTVLGNQTSDGLCGTWRNLPEEHQVDPQGAC